MYYGGAPLDRHCTNLKNAVSALRGDQNHRPPSASVNQACPERISLPSLLTPQCGN
jgi:hypothetical protein